MYQPAMRPDQVRSLYFLKRQRRKPMTVLVREAVDEYLQRHGEQHGESVMMEKEAAQHVNRHPLV